MKTCKKCGETRPLVEFSRKANSTDGHQSWCKKCALVRQREWARNNRGKIAEYDRRNNLKRLYGLTEAQFAAIKQAQGDACAICREPFTKSPHVDHCHETGAVRALLCGPCNTGLGHFRDDPVRLRAATAYIELHQSSQRRNTN